MRIFSGFARFAGGYRSAIGFGVFLAVLASSAGCGHKTEQSASTPQQANATEPSQAGANASSPAVSSPTSNSAAPADSDLAALNRAMRRWLIANRRAPKNFDEFAATAGVPIPPAPPGKKYVLTQNMHVQLVNQ